MTTISAPGLLLDTDVLIDISRPHPAALAWLATLPVAPEVAGIAAMELIAGCRDGNELRRAQRLLRGFERRWPSDSDAERALTTYLPLRLAHGIGLNDTLIAATATGAGLTLCTLNVRHFQHIPGLSYVRPYTK